MRAWRCATPWDSLACCGLVVAVAAQECRTPPFLGPRLIDAGGHLQSPRLFAP